MSARLLALRQPLHQVASNQTRPSVGLTGVSQPANSIVMGWILSPKPRQMAYRRAAHLAKSTGYSPTTSTAPDIGGVGISATITPPQALSPHLTVYSHPLARLCTAWNDERFHTIVVCQGALAGPSPANPFGQPLTGPACRYASVCASRGRGGQALAIAKSPEGATPKPS